MGRTKKDYFLIDKNYSIFTTYIDVVVRRTLINYFLAIEIIFSTLDSSSIKLFTLFVFQLYKFSIFSGILNISNANCFLISSFTLLLSKISFAYFLSILVINVL
jgi:hypothetical protein